MPSCQAISTSPKPLAHQKSGAPSAIASEVAAQYGVVAVGATEAVRERFFLITVERRISHPAARVVSEAARSGLFTAAAPVSG